MKARNMALCALFAALLAVCAWLAIPVGVLVFSMQTFGIFLALALLGGKRGTAAIFVYLLLGAMGLPVFTGFRGGIGTLLGATGGYIAGFLFTGLVYWLVTALAGTSQKICLLAMLLGLLVCYVFGSIWFCFGYLSNGSAMGLGMVLAKCVLPYLLPDILKLVLAWNLAKRLRPFIFKKFSA